MKIRVKLISDLLRIKQWLKNFLIYAALLFTNNLFNVPYFIKVTTGFFLLSFAASALYILNDLKDYKEDRHHPEKRNRPIASGAVKKDFAVFLSAFLMLIALAGAYVLGLYFFYVILAYIIITNLYTYWLKHVVILDLLLVASGFVLRAVAGATIIHVSISPWFLVVTSLLALFVVMAKRRFELNMISDASKHRKILEEYSITLLDEMISVVTASTVISYSLYTFTSETAAHHNYLMLTIPFVLYGIFRYLYLIHKKNLGGSPEMIFLKDIPMIINMALWVISTVVIVYFIK